MFSHVQQEYFHHVGGQRALTENVQTPSFLFFFFFPQSGSGDRVFRRISRVHEQTVQRLTPLC